jgi:GNAT superfamily N-acetyltransferase
MFESAVEMLNTADDALLDDSFRLRVVAWRASGIELSFFRDDRWQDEHDDHSLHWIVRAEDGHILASARMCIHDSIAETPDAPDWADKPHSIVGRVASLNCLVIDPSMRGQGLPKEFDSVRIRVAREQGCKYVVGVTWVPSRMCDLQSAGFIDFGPSSLSDLTSQVAGHRCFALKL